MVTSPQPAKKSKLDMGYINIRISKKAHRALVKKALADQRTIIATLEMLLHV